MLLVEDDAAAAFARAWLSDKDASLLSQYEIVVMDSNGDIVSALKKSPSKTRSFTIVGLFDGDQRSEQKVIKGRRWGWSFLPGTLSPEEELLRFMSLAISALAERARKTTVDVRYIINSIAGEDHHDRFRELALHLEISIEILAETLYDAWVSDDTNSTSAQQALEDLRKAIVTRSAPEPAKEKPQEKQ